MAMVKRFLKIILIIVTGAAALFLVLLLYFNSVRWFDLARQKGRVENLRNEVTNGTYKTVEEGMFVKDFDPKQSDLKLNEIQLLATHNSYKRYGSALGKLFIGLGDSFNEAKNLKYSYAPLTEQLNTGIRSFELDLRYRKDDFEVVHVPLVDNSSNVTNFKLGLEEIKIWSDANPEHLPLIFLLELKSDWMILDPALSDFGTAQLNQLDELLTSIFGGQLLKPADVIGDYSTLNQAVTEKGWPNLDTVKGKVIFILHPGKYTDTYAKMDETFTRMAMFPAVSDTDTDHPYTAFVIHNNPDVKTIRSLISRNYIVRTRINDTLVFDDSRLQAALESGAQILSSDFTKGRNDRGNLPFVFFENKYYIRSNPYLVP